MGPKSGDMILSVEIKNGSISTPAITPERLTAKAKVATPLLGVVCYAKAMDLIIVYNSTCVHV